MQGLFLNGFCLHTQRTVDLYQYFHHMLYQWKPEAKFSERVMCLIILISLNHNWFSHVWFICVLTSSALNVCVCVNWFTVCTHNVRLFAEAHTIVCYWFIETTKLTVRWTVRYFFFFFMFQTKQLNFESMVHLPVSFAFLSININHRNNMYLRCSNQQCAKYWKFR